MLLTALAALGPFETHLAADDEDLAVWQDNRIGKAAREVHGRQRMHRCIDAVLVNHDDVRIRGGRGVLSRVSHTSGHRDMLQNPADRGRRH